MEMRDHVYPVEYDLQFDPAAHAYRLDGQPVPSVTQIVRDVLPIQWQADPWYMERGTMIHRAMALLEAGALDPASVDPRIVGFVSAGQRALREMRLAAEHIELRLAHHALRFAGTMDLLTADGVLVDWKSGSGDNRVEIQLGGYALLCAAHKIKVRWLMCIELREDGTYQVTRYDVRRGTGLFRAGMTIYQWKQQHRQE